MGAIVVPFDPVALRAGPLVLTWHGLFSAVGILVGLYVAAWLAPAPAFVREPWRLVLLNEGGISVFGAVLGGLAGATWWARRNGVVAVRLLDAVAPGFLIGQAIGRIGDVVN